MKSEKKLSEKEMDRLVVSQVEHDSTWDNPVRVRKAKKWIWLGVVFLVVLYAGANAISAYREYNEVKQYAYDGYVMYSFKLYVSMTPAYEIETWVRGNYNAPSMKLSLFECDNDSDGRVDDPSAFQINIDAIRSRFYEEFAKCGRVGDKALYPYYWVIAQNTWTPFGGQLLGMKPIKLTVMESSKLSALNVVLVADADDFSTISSCGTKYFPACSQEQETIKSMVDYAQLPYGNLTFIVWESGKQLDSNPCKSLSLSDLEKAKCHSFSSQKVEHWLPKAEEVLLATHNMDRPILIVLSRRMTIDDIKTVTQKDFESLRGILIIGISDDSAYFGFGFDHWNDYWTEYELEGDSRSRAEELIILIHRLLWPRGE